jgi:hypothetical protein
VGGVPSLGVEGVSKVKKAFQAALNVQKQRRNGQFPALIDLKNAKKRCFFLLKST